LQCHLQCHLQYKGEPMCIHNKRGYLNPVAHVYARRSRPVAFNYYACRRWKVAMQRDFFSHFECSNIFLRNVLYQERVSMSMDMPMAMDMDISMMRKKVIQMYTDTKRELLENIRKCAF
jgi:hypothetical protein